MASSKVANNEANVEGPWHGEKHKADEAVLDK